MDSKVQSADEIDPSMLIK